ncbi:MAG: phosphate acyltransferase PlsX [Verrucomicrobia subdivision 3 bacterium]|nr:phosphate acyltransferase PlsX [Limisphaerales bacterium]
MRIALDVMGGDHGSGVVIEGARLALEAIAGITEIHLAGDRAEIESELAKFCLKDPRVRVVHASEVLTMEDPPEAIRKKKDCSLLRAVELVRDGKADAIISPGNTGALVAASSFRLRRLEGVERAPIATLMPSRTTDYILLDAGANHECKPIYLAQFAVMGSVYSREVLGHPKPRVGILSNGTEESKGTGLTRESARLCRQLDLNFIGYVEGHDLFEDRVDVVVTDGFVGNIVLKTCESMGKAILNTLKEGLTATPVRKLGAALSRGAFASLKRRLDPDLYGGAPLLGLNGNVIKAHGTAREKAIMNAIRVGTETIQHHLKEVIAREIAQANRRLPREAGAVSAAA